MKKFLIKVRCLTRNPHSVDLEYFGIVAFHKVCYQFLIEARNKDQALDIFHETIPIKVLDDFEISIRTSNKKG